MENSRQKAVSLINLFNIVVLDTALGGSNRRVKRCAIITVDQLINVAPWCGDNENDIDNGSKEFYIKVKQEIEKL
jgi:hypothetical protein